MIGSTIFALVNKNKNNNKNGAGDPEGFYDASPSPNSPPPGRMHRRERSNASDDGSTSSEIFWTVFAIVVVVEMIVGGFAAYLSWTSNGLIGWGTPAKVFFAACAFFSGVHYMLTHLVNKLDLIRFIKANVSAPIVFSPPRLPNATASPYNLGAPGRY